MKAWFVVCVCVLAMGCVESGEVESRGVESEDIRTMVFESEEIAPQFAEETDVEFVLGDRADGLVAGPPTWSVKRDGTELEVVTTLKPTWRDNMLRWELHGRMDPPPERIAGIDVHQNRHEATITDHAFVFELDQQTTLDLLSGYALELEVSHKDAKTQSGLVRFKPAFHGFKGTSAMWVYRWMHAIDTPQGRVFRARAGTKPGYALESVWTDDDVEAHVRPDVSGGRWIVDFAPEDLLLASDFPDPVFFNIVDSDDKRSRKESVVELRLIDLRLVPDRSRLAGLDPQCSKEVMECLNALDGEAQDTETCGQAVDVEPCYNVRQSR